MTAETLTRPGPRTMRRRGSATGGSALAHLGLTVGALVMVAPFAWMLVTSVKTLPQVLQAPLSLIPRPFTLQNYSGAFAAVSFPRAYWNSIYICALTVAITLLTCSMAAYAFARIEFRGAKVLFGLFLATQMLPTQVTIIPLYLLLSKIGWIDSHLALIIPASLSNPFAVFLIRQFIRSLPEELEEAARIDGAGRWRIFFSIVLPNIRSGLAAMGIVTALGSWNSFFFPLVVLNSPRLFTVPMLLSQFVGQFGGVNYAMVMAASAASIVPMLIAFLIGHKHILNSMAMSGLGGR